MYVDLYLCDLFDPFPVFCQTGLRRVKEIDGVVEYVIGLYSILRTYCALGSFLQML